MRRWKARASELLRTGTFRAASSVRVLSGLGQLGGKRKPLQLLVLAMSSHAFAINEALRALQRDREFWAVFRSYCTDCESGSIIKPQRC